MVVTYQDYDQGKNGNKYKREQYYQLSSRFLEMEAVQTLLVVFKC